MSIRKCLPLLVPVLLCGCAHGFDRDALRERLNDGTLQSPDAAIAEARGLRPQLKFPCRVAVYLKPSNDRDWRWTPEDRAALEQLAVTLKAEGIAAEVFPLPDMLSGKGEMKELRLAAAQCGADVLFVVHGAAQTDSYKNFAAVFNLTIVGGYVVPASHKDTLFFIEGVLFDVDNGYIYTGVQAEGVGKIVRPTFVVEEKDSVALAKSKAVTEFGSAALARFRSLAGKAPPSDVPAIRPTPNSLRSSATSGNGPKPKGAGTGPGVSRAQSGTERKFGAIRRLLGVEIQADDADAELKLAAQLTFSDTLTRTDEPVATFTGFQEARDLATARAGWLPTGGIWSLDIRNAQLNAGGVMTGITAPRPNP